MHVKIAGISKIIYFLSKNIVCKKISKKFSLGHIMLYTFLMTNASKNVWCTKKKGKIILCQSI